MTEVLPWHRSLTFRLGGALVVAFAIVVGVVLLDAYALQKARVAAEALVVVGDAPRSEFKAVRLAEQVIEGGGATSPKAVELRDALVDEDGRIETARALAQRLGNQPIIDGVARRSDRWATQIRPQLARIAESTDVAASQAMLDAAEPAFQEQMDDAEGAVERNRTNIDNEIHALQEVQYVLIVVLVLALTAALVLAQGVARRTRALATSADRITSGELAHAAPIEGTDELAALGRAFNGMTTRLREMLDTEKAARERLERLLDAVRTSVNRLASGSAQILGSVQAQGASAQEQAAAIAETVSTVDQVLQTAEQASQRAKAVSEAARRSVEVGRAGRQSVEDSIAAMDAMKDRMETVAGSILNLAEQAQAIGEIIATVSDIAVQTNLLALNAGIEASRAGEHGRGFSVVASEIRALADQSRGSTVQVRRILSEIQAATQAAVLATEEGTRDAGRGRAVVTGAGETIRDLATIIEDAAQAAAQIAASASQQVVGMSQIHQAMRDIRQATDQSLAATRQGEAAAADLTALGGSLKELVAGD